MEYRPNVMIVLRDSRGKFLVAHKTRAPENDWYFPGGGIEKGESVTDAFFRESYEELGLSKDDISDLVLSDITNSYDWNEELVKKMGFRGQHQNIVIARVIHPEKINLKITNELDGIKFVDFKQLFDIIPHNDLKDTVRKLAKVYGWK